MKPANQARTFVADRVAVALDELLADGPLEPRVHEARKNLRKARAVLKLLRPSLRKSDYRRQNALCRQAARLLSRTRDAQALAAAFEKLRVAAPAVRRALTQEVRRAARALDPHESAALLTAANGYALHVPTGLTGWRGVKDGLRRTYAEGRKAWRRARRTGLDADFHDWRKRVKDARYQTELLVAVDKPLDRLAELLGDDHDLCVLRGKLPLTEVEALQALGRKQAALRAEALSLAERLYDETPRRYERGVKKAWKRARDLKQ